MPITVGIPISGYSNKDGWSEFIKVLLGEDSVTINLDPWTDKPGEHYSEALLPKNVDFIIFDGGADIHPILYKEAKHQTTHSNIVRDWAELIIFQRYLKLPTKFIGICRGCQFLNVAMGGSLYQDLPSLQKGHYGIHMNDIMPDTKFHKTMGMKSLRVNSLHHQAINILGVNLLPIMTDINFGIVEGIESKRGDKIRAVQSHPEYDNREYESRMKVMGWLLRKEGANV